MTLVLAPDIEERVRTVASGQGLPPEEALNSLLTQALAEAEAELESTLAALKASEEDFAAGRSLSLEEWRTRMDAKIEAKRQAGDGSQSSRTKQETARKTHA